MTRNHARAHRRPTPTLGAWRATSPPAPTRSPRTLQTDDTAYRPTTASSSTARSAPALRRVAGPVHRARGRHRGRVPPAAPRERRARSASVREGTADDAENSLRELAALAETAGAVVLDGLLQRRPHPDPAHLPRHAARRRSCATSSPRSAPTPSSPTPSSPRASGARSRTSSRSRSSTAPRVILDIFSQHAKSREGKAQVELAQLEYLLPRLRGWGESMSRQAGGQVGGAGAGMGSRGPGETKIELDRRRIHTRMAKLRRRSRT